ncbi:MAG: hypothetical protein GWP08_08605 [Nitrospiraceae bacterium]|nr:hypothetical protein [Nitrospiraceae bacterium]
MDNRHNRVWYWLVLLLVVAATVSYAHRRNLVERYFGGQARQQEIQEQEWLLSALKKEVSASSEHVVHLDDDPFALESEGRSNRDLVREGETIYRIQEMAPVEQ